MKARRTLALSLLGVIVAGAVGLGVAAPADAATSKWSNIGTSPKQLMLNVLGSVLGAVVPNSKLGNLKRSVISADQVYDHSWDLLDQQWKLNAANVPNTYSDYVLQKQEYFDSKGLTSKQGDLSTAGTAKKYVNTKRTFPATKSAQFAKTVAGVAGAAVAVTAWDHRLDVGSGVAQLVGVDDTTGAICANSQFLTDNGASAVAGFQNWLTGADCNAWEASKAYNANSDFVPDYTGKACKPGDPNTCLTITGSRTYTIKSTDNTTLWGAAGTVSQIRCFNVVPNTTNLNNFTMKLASGKTHSADWPTDTPGWLNSYCAVSDPSSGAAWRWAKTSNPMDDIVGIKWTTDTAYQTVAKEPSDPDRYETCSMTGTDGKTYSAQTPSFKESGTRPAPICPVLPDGVAPTNVNVQEQGPRGATPIVQQSTTPEFNNWWSQYPECREGACALDLVRKSDNKSCFQDETMWTACVDWFTDPNKALDYQCTYGAHNVDLTECYAYSDVFKPDKVSQGNGWTDPTTGLPTAGPSSPDATQKALQRPIVDPQDYEACYASTWNGDWFTAGIVAGQCVLQWGFAPRQSAVDQALVTVKTSWTNTPFTQVPQVLQNFGSIPVITGCQGIPIDVDFDWPAHWGIHWRFGAACDDPLKSVAQTVSGLLSALVYAGTAAAFSWYIAASLGWIGFGRRS